MFMPYPSNLVASVALAADILASMAIAVPAYAAELRGTIDDLEEVGDLLIIDAHYEQEVAHSA